MDNWTKPPSLAKKISVMFGSWLVPGLGFWIHGARVQAVIMFLLVQLLFIGGLCFSGAVMVPTTFNPLNPGANIVAILTFLIQMLNGSGLFISLLWPANETASFHDLGCFWLMVGAGLNYYTMLSIWDNYFAPPKEDTPATELQEEE